MQTELIHNADGSVYHLALHPDEVADLVVLVGDPQRVEVFLPLMSKVTSQHQKREFHSLTGERDGQRFTVVSTGIGTDNVEIVVMELDALVNPVTASRKLQFVRFGTCGTIQASIAPGDWAASTGAYGTDTLAYFYPAAHSDAEPFSRAEEFRRALAEVVRGGRAVPPVYYAEGKGSLQQKPMPASCPKLHWGNTLTCPGFYAPQGRNIGRAEGIYLSNWHNVMADWRDEDGIPLINLEMETAGLFHLANVLGHSADSLSVVLANRSTGHFHPNPAQAVKQLVAQGLEWILAK